MSEPVEAAALESRPHVLYRMYDAGGTLLYVGITMNVEMRFASHREEKDWWASIASTTLEHFPTRNAAVRAEQSAIQAELPRHNLVHRAKEQGPKRPPGRPATGQTFVARARVPIAKWKRFGELAADAGTDRSKLLNEFVHWYLGEADAVIPERPR